jgi:hypothetical protein
MSIRLALPLDDLFTAPIFDIFRRPLLAFLLAFCNRIGMPRAAFSLSVIRP